MSTDYCAFPKKIIIETGLKELFHKSAQSLLEEALEMVKPEYERSEDYSSSKEMIEREVIEIGTISATRNGPVFTKRENISKEQLEKILKNPDYLIIGHGKTEYFEVDQFRAKIEKNLK